MGGILLTPLDRVPAEGRQHDWVSPGEAAEGGEFGQVAQSGGSLQTGLAVLPKLCLSRAVVKA